MEGQKKHSNNPISLSKILKGTSLSNTIIATSALIVSVCALVVSILEVQVMRSQEKAMVYPHLRVKQGYNEKGFYVEVSNKGTGPAIVDDVRVEYKGNYPKDWDEVIDLILPAGHNVTYSIYKTTEISDAVIQAGEELELFSVPWNDETYLLSEGMQDLKYQICYCSVLNDCWAIEKNKRPVPTDCQIDESIQFQN